MDTFKSHLIDALADDYYVADSADGWNSLNSPEVDFIVDDSFDFGNCATSGSCSTSYCSIDNGADMLASKIVGMTLPYDHVIIVGYSMGGLIGRDMMLRAVGNQTLDYMALLGRRITALITLGTPNLGYPWDPADDPAGIFLGTCPVESDQMASDFTSGQNSTLPTVAFQSTGNVALPSAWMESFVNSWSLTTLPPNWPAYWYAISGNYCHSPLRNVPSWSSRGCPSYNQWSDGVVCDQSARYQMPDTDMPYPPIKVAVDAARGQTILRGPARSQAVDDYAHSANAIMCGLSTAGSTLLYNPDPGDDVFFNIVGVIESHK